MLFHVKVTGVPHPNLTWYHNGVEVKADYSRDLAEDGSLSLPSSESKHSGVYRLVALNSVGRTEREVRLTVEEEGQNKSTSNKPTLAPCYSCHTCLPTWQPRGEKSYQEQQGFQGGVHGIVKLLVDVSVLRCVCWLTQSLYDGREKTISIATNSENKLKNRFGNICVCKWNSNSRYLIALSEYM